MLQRLHFPCADKRELSFTRSSRSGVFGGDWCEPESQAPVEDFMTHAPGEREMTAVACSQDHTHALP